MSDNGIRQEYPVKSGDFNAAGDVSSSIKQVLKKLGISSALVRRISICAYESELNMVIHSLGGIMSLEVDDSSVVVICDDNGPGIPDVELAMSEGYSTAPESARMLGFGAGMGLPNMKRCSDDMSIRSVVGEGTRIEMKFFL